MKKKRLISTLFCLLFILGIRFNGSCSIGREIKKFSFYYGSNYRFDQNYQHHFSVEILNMRSNCLATQYSGYGMSSARTNRSTYNWGFRLFTSFGTLRSHPTKIFYMAIEPSYFSIEKLTGIAIAPEVGIHILEPLRIYRLDLNAYYGYDIPVLRAQNHNLKRHHITLKLAFSLNIRKLKKR